MTLKISPCFVLLYSFFLNNFQPFCFVNSHFFQRRRYRTGIYYLDLLFLVNFNGPSLRSCRPQVGNYSCVQNEANLFCAQDAEREQEGRGEREGEREGEKEEREEGRQEGRQALRLKKSQPNVFYRVLEEYPAK